jgi:AraC family transcriptional regulator
VRILAVIIAISLIAFLGLSYYAGLFDKVDIALSDAGPFNLIYREHKGPYRAIQSVRYDVFRFLKENRSIAPQKGFAVFFDNPRKKNPGELRSRGGYITDSLLSGVPAPYVAEIFPRTASIVATFPLRSFMSSMTGPMKFYPEMLALLTRQKREAAGPVMEIYDVLTRKITYIAPLK